MSVISRIERLKQLAIEHAGVAGRLCQALETLLQYFTKCAPESEAVQTSIASTVGIDWLDEIATHLEEGTTELLTRLRLVEGASSELKEISEVDQTSEPFENFTEEERTIGEGLVIVAKSGTEAPWINPYGVNLVKIYGIRRKNGRVEFGIGNETPPILAWVTANCFHYEWPV